MSRLLQFAGCIHTRFLAAVLLAALVFCASARAQDLHVFAAASLKEALDDAAAERWQSKS